MQSVKVANKSITRDHKVFGHIFRIMEMLTELVTACEKEKRVTALAIENKTGHASHASHAIGLSHEEITKRNAECNILKHLSDELIEIMNVCKLLYKYYSEYILRFVEEYGEASAFKFQFSGNNTYMLALAKLVDHQLPLFDSTVTGSAAEDNPLSFLNSLPDEGEETDDEGEWDWDDENANYESDSDGGKTGTYGRDNTNPRSKTVSTPSGVHFTSQPFAPGISNAINCLINQFTDSVTPPSRLLRTESKSVAALGKVTFYLASTNLSSHNLSNVFENQLTDRMDPMRFSAMMMAFLVGAVANVKPRNIMVKLVEEESDRESDDDGSVMDERGHRDRNRNRNRNRNTRNRDWDDEDSYHSRY